MMYRIYEERNDIEDRCIDNVLFVLYYIRLTEYEEGRVWIDVE